MGTCQITVSMSGNKNASSSFFFTNWMFLQFDQYIDATFDLHTVFRAYELQFGGRETLTYFFKYSAQYMFIIYITNRHRAFIHNIMMVILFSHIFLASSGEDGKTTPDGG